jgi:hypothetical protein
MLTGDKGSCPQTLSGRWQWRATYILHSDIDIRQASFGASNGNTCWDVTEFRLFPRLSIASYEQKPKGESMGLPQ